MIFSVLFIADAKVKWDEYKKCKVISLTSASIVTEDPNVPEAIAVRNYARNAPFNFNDIMEDMSKRIPDCKNDNLLKCTTFLSF
jgi:hypothetical protein